MLSNNLAIGSLSLSQHPSHQLDKKIGPAARHGLKGIEIVYSDLETFASAQEVSMLQGAARIKELCQRLGIKILSLAPFENFEGSDVPIQQRLERAKLWIDIAAELGATYLQVPAQYDEACRGNRSCITSDLKQLADLAASVEPNLAVAYEPMSWSVHNATWEEALETINAVDRPNFGLCLDSFHVLTRLWASPFESSGKYPNADSELSTSLSRFQTLFPMEKLFYIQLSDGERFDPPFSTSHAWFTDGEAPEFTWSKYARPFPLEHEFGGYMPVDRFLNACVVEKGFTGWISLEIFDRRMRDETFEPEAAAVRGVRSWEKLVKEVSKLGSKL